jgi:hypothetical protein
MARHLDSLLHNSRLGSSFDDYLPLPTLPSGLFSFNHNISSQVLIICVKQPFASINSTESPIYLFLHIYNFSSSSNASPISDNGGLGTIPPFPNIGCDCVVEVAGFVSGARPTNRLDETNAARALSMFSKPASLLGPRTSHWEELRKNNHSHRHRFRRYCPRRHVHPHLYLVP